VFIGWAKTKSGKVVYKNAQAVKNLRTDGKTTTLYAKWAKTNYKVAFNANGGTGTMAPQAMVYNKAANLRKNAFKRSGCVFIGWATSKSGKVVYKNAQAVKNLRTDGKTTTLYAKWAKVNYKVSFDKNGGTGSMTAQAMKYNTAANLKKNAFKRTGWTFAGWAKSATGGVAYKDRQSVKNLTASGAVTLYAKWAATTYKIAFDANGGEGTMPVQSVKYGSTATLTANRFTCEGSSFLGWATSPDGVAEYANQAQVKNLVSDAGTLTLYAVWGGGAPDGAARPKSGTPAAAAAETVFSVDGCGIFAVGGFELEIASDEPALEELSALEEAEELPEPVAVAFRVPAGAAAWRLWSAARGTFADGDAMEATAGLELPDLGLWYWLGFFDADGGVVTSTWLFLAE
jgi:uncharacterized repeat protein (TIGR02543 family)